MLDWILYWDTQLLIFLNNLGCYSYDEFWRLVSEKFTWIPLYATLLFLLTLHYKRKKLLLVLLAVGVTFFFTDFVVSQIFRPLFHRLRPCHLETLSQRLRLVKESCGGQYGFPSAHASNSFGLAIIVGKLLFQKFPKMIYILIFWAVFVAYSRIYLGVHYPLDVTAGAIYGGVVASVVYKGFKKIVENGHRT